MKGFWRALALAGAAAVAACSAPIHIGQPVELPAKGQWQVAVGSGVSGSSAALDLVQAANDKANSLAKQQLQCKDTQNRSDCLPSLQMREMVRGTYALGLAGTVDVNLEAGGLAWATAWLLAAAFPALASGSTGCGNSWTAAKAAAGAARCWWATATPAARRPLCCKTPWSS